MRRLEHEFGDALQVEWRAFLLRPSPDPGRSLERFRAYTHSWLRPAAEPDAPVFNPWASDEGPPSHSIPAHAAARVAASFDGAAFRRVHDRLLRAYFTESRDITRPETLAELWRECGLPAAALERAFMPETHAAVVAEHQEALAHGVTGVPAVMMMGNDVPTLGALPYETYRRWIARALRRED
jgi:predicted DsbA family dithiol-disulfide isomerase